VIRVFLVCPATLVTLVNRVREVRQVLPVFLDYPASLEIQGTQVPQVLLVLQVPVVLKAHPENLLKPRWWFQSRLSR
jgi:hypothetical protein